jgi:hypothetical protein
VKQEVARIQAQEAVTGKSRATVEKEKEQQMRATEKLEAETRKKEEAALLRPVHSQKVPVGVDPKTVLCAFFKAGHCDKGNKCKFSHDLNVDRKVEKKNLYADSREDKMNGAFCVLLGWGCAQWRRRYDGHVGPGEAGAGCPLENWKPSDNDRCTFVPPPTPFPELKSLSQIVCKHFIQAIETQKCAGPLPTHPLTITPT